MGSNHALVSLSDLIKVKHGFAFKGEYFSEHPTDKVLVTPGNFKIGGGFKHDKYKYYQGPISPEYILEQDDLIITMTDLSKEGDTLGYSALSPSSKSVTFLHNQRIGKVEFKTDAIDKYYLYFLLQSPEYRHHVVSTATGSTVKHTSPSKIESFNFHLPDIDTQKKIANLLLSLEIKSNILTETNQTLEEMAQAIFKSWFVDFDPVKAKAQVIAQGGSEQDANLAAMQIISGKTRDQLAALEHTHPEQYTQLHTTASLFPSAFEESELGEIPEGWEVNRIEDIATLTSDRMSSAELNNENYISTENMLENKRGIATASNHPSQGKVPAFLKRDILISNIRPYFKKIWFSAFEGGRSPDVLGFRAKDSELAEFLYNLLYQDSFFDHMMKTSKGVKMPRGDKEAIMQWKFVMPTREIAIRYSKSTANIYKRIYASTKQSESLKNIRDLLLPELLSGSIQPLKNNK